MKKKKFTLRTVTDIKVFLLFLLEHIRYPVDRTTLINIVSENTDEIIIDYDGCLTELADSGHVWEDEDTDGEKYFGITDSGTMVAAELFDSLDPAFREKSLKSAIKHMSLSKRGAKATSTIEAVEGGRFRVTLTLSDQTGALMNTSFVVFARSEAEKIRDNFLQRPEDVYRGILLSSTGRLEYLR